MPVEGDVNTSRRVGTGGPYVVKGMDGEEMAERHVGWLVVVPIGQLSLEPEPELALALEPEQFAAAGPVLAGEHVAAVDSMQGYSYQPVLPFHIVDETAVGSVAVAVAPELEFEPPVEPAVVAYAGASSDFVEYDMVVGADRENWPEVDGEGPYYGCN